MIQRELQAVLLESAGQYPVVTLTGPRQSGKTTLCRASFPDKPYVSLEALDTRAYAKEDPRGFLAEYSGGAIIDEFQNAPGLASYLQGDVDRNPTPGRFVLTGSQNLTLSQTVSQSLAGRSAILHLLPPSLAELRRFEAPPQELFEVMVAGAYPRIFDGDIPHRRWLSDYVATYVQRDVRQLTHVQDLEAFTRFLRLAAARSGCEVNLSALGADAGVSHNTARAWLSVLEASFLICRVPAWHRNTRKQLVKAPKLHFLDTGLACHLLGIHEAEQLRHHPLRGALFESWVFSELYKQQLHQGRSAPIHHYRDSRRLVVDLLVELAGTLSLVEVKSGATVQSSHFKNLHTLGGQLQTSLPELQVRKVLVYGGQSSSTRSGVRVLAWSELDQFDR